MTPNFSKTYWAILVIFKNFQVLVVSVCTVVTSRYHVNTSSKCSRKTTELHLQFTKFQRERKTINKRKYFRVYPSFYIKITMVMYEIHSHPVLQKYKSHICNRASVFQLFIAIFTVLFPLLVAYASQGTDISNIFLLLWLVHVFLTGRSFAVVRNIIE